MTVIPFGPRERTAPTAPRPAAKTEPQSHREMDAWPRTPLPAAVPPRARPSLTLVR